MVSYAEHVERDLPMHLEVEPILDKMAQQVQNLFKFKTFTTIWLQRRAMIGDHNCHHQAD